MTDPHHALLARFIAGIDRHQDTPSLMMFIAADADHIQACRWIIDRAVHAGRLPAPVLERICHCHGWRLDDLREKLTPAAESLGILPADGVSPNPYQVLGVPQTATVREIRQAFRSRAFSVHPDTAPRRPADNQRFHDLLDAYDRLRHVDAKCSGGTGSKRRWREYPTQLFAVDDGPSVYRWYLGGLIIIFIILLFITIAIN